MDSDRERYFRRVVSCLQYSVATVEKEGRRWYPMSEDGDYNWALVRNSKLTGMHGC